jgi:hypothetical protein
MLALSVLQTRFSVAEVCAMRVDGESWPVGSADVVIDMPIDTHARIAVIASELPDGLVVMGVAAAWVWGCMPAIPDKRDVARADGLRLGTTLPQHFRIRDVFWTDGDIVTTNAGAVTSIPRTMLDIARYETRVSEREILRVLCDLNQLLPCSREDALQRLHATAHLPYKSRALERLAKAQNPAA